MVNQRVKESQVLAEDSRFFKEKHDRTDLDREEIKTKETAQKTEEWLALKSTRKWDAQRKQSSSRYMGIDQLVVSHSFTSILEPQMDADEHRSFLKLNSPEIRVHLW